MENQATKQVCGLCNDEWLTEDEYNNHVCPNTGYAPTQPEHLIASTTPDFADISAAALERGSESQVEQPAPAEQPVPVEQPPINLG